MSSLNLENEHPFIKGLFIFPDYITEELEKELLENIDSWEWSTIISRRTQPYGYEYDYKEGPLVKGKPIPKILNDLGSRLFEEGLMDKLPEQINVNEYAKYQGIKYHIESDDFGPVLVSVSLNDDTNYIMKCGKDKHKIHVPRRSAVVISGQARIEWYHFF
jgi:alkylated DNA repair dioxygenase AlkB